MIVDAGGGTIDVSSYRKVNDNSFEEIAIPGCYFQGASYVSMRAEQYLNGLYLPTFLTMPTSCRTPGLQIVYLGRASKTTYLRSSRDSIGAPNMYSEVPMILFTFSSRLIANVIQN